MPNVTSKQWLTVGVMAVLTGAAAYLEVHDKSSGLLWFGVFLCFWSLWD